MGPPIGGGPPKCRMISCWIIRSARARSGRPISERLAQELLEAARGQGSAVRRREELHRMAEANRAFVHYRW